MRKKAVSTTRTFIRLACAALLVFAGFPLAFGSADISQMSRETGDGGSAVSSAPDEGSLRADAPDAPDAASGEVAPSEPLVTEPPADGSDASAPAPVPAPNSDQPAPDAPEPAPEAPEPAPDASAPPAPEAPAPDAGETAPDATAPPAPEAPAPEADQPAPDAPAAPDSQQDPAFNPDAADAAPPADADPALDPALAGFTPLALLRAAIPSALPRGSFAWTYVSTGPDTCKITGWNNILPTGGANGTVTVPATAIVDGVTKKVTSINRVTYRSYQNLTCHVDFSRATNLKRIENLTFQEAPLSGSLDLPNNLTYLGMQSFQNCPHITSLKLPDSPNFTTIQSNTFSNVNSDRSSLTGTVTIPVNVTSIGDSAFSGNKITGVQFDQNSRLTTIPPGAFQDNQISGTVTFPDSVTSFKPQAFMNNRITEVRFSMNSVDVGASCFRNNRIAHDPMNGHKFGSLDNYCFAGNLIDSVDFSGVQGPYPGRYILSDNPQLVSVVLSPSWVYLPEGLLQNDTALTSVTYPQLPSDRRPSLERITTKSFQGCTALRTIDFRDAPLQDSVNGIAIGVSAFQGCTSLEEVILGTKPVELEPGFVTRTITVSNDAFRDCTSLKTAIIPPPPPGKHVVYKIGDRAFMNTDLGDYATYPGAIPGVPVGTLPLSGREIESIGSQAYQNANLKDIWLPSTLTKVGANAFSNNHMGTLTLPYATTSVGANILSGQTLDGSAYYGDVEAGADKANVMVEALRADFGVDLSHITSLMLSPAGKGPDNGDWATTGKARFDLSALQAPDATLKYDLNVYRQWGDAPVSTGDVTVPRIEEGVPFEFQLYDDADYSSFDQSFVQWLAAGKGPQDPLNGVPNFGMANKPGYHAQSGAYVSPDGPIPPGKVANAGWKWVSGMPSGTPSGTPVDPAQEVAVPHTTPAFANRWLANSYEVAFDDNWNLMVASDPALGKQEPVDPSNPDGDKQTVRDDSLVWGSLPDKTGLAFGTPAALPANNPPSSASASQGTGYKMANYDFVGWATTPDLAVADRHEGSNFFSPGAQISTPDPAPGNGGKVTLYAQWKAKDLTNDPLVNGSIMIPARIQMQQDGAHLWSKSPAPKDLPGFPGALSLPLHAVPIWAVQGAPGASWPDGIRYAVYVKRPATGAPLLSLALSPSDDSPRAVDVLKTPDAAPYDPGPDPNAPVSPLMELLPSNQSVASALFYLRSQDTPWSFTPNESYSGAMTFVLEQATPSGS